MLMRARKPTASHRVTVLTTAVAAGLAVAAVAPAGAAWAASPAAGRPATTKPKPRPATTAKPSAATVAGRLLLRSQEQPGFVVNGVMASQTSVSRFLSSFGTTKAERSQLSTVLDHAGFHLSAVEDLLGSQGRQGSSELLELRNAAGARSVVTAFLGLTRHNERGAQLASFSVKGVPSATGIVARGGSVAIANVYWTVGSCMLASGLYLPQGGKETVAMVAAPVISGVRSQAHRIGRSCP